MKQYFFGYLFVRIAKLLAITIVAIGIAYAIFRIAQGKVAAESVRYQLNNSLSRQLQSLMAKLSDTRGLVSRFTKEKTQTALSSFPDTVESNEQFGRLAEALHAMDLERQGLKHSILERFETSVSEIQTKLRAHAASLSPSNTAVPTPSTPHPTSTPQTALTQYKAETLFSDLSAEDIDMRISTLDNTKQFLSVLETTAENPENRSKLVESINQLDALRSLLPSKTEERIEAEAGPTQVVQPPTSEQRKTLNAEKVADQLQQLRALVRRTILSSWALDDAFDRVSALSLSEQDKCRSATLVVKGIWLSAFGQIATGAIATGFIAFLILVMADLIQTLLDTATNTRVIAERRSE